MTRFSHLLQTKFHIPRRRIDTLVRSKLVDHLKSGLGKSLILLSAPAGYGKTTLLSQFAFESPGLVAWYQLDNDDNDSVIFSEYLLDTSSKDRLTTNSASSQTIGISHISFLKYSISSFHNQLP
jgi:LuxR family maltose regulon positive regulatory protein